MTSESRITLKFELIAACIALLGAAAQWFKSDWFSALLMFGLIFFAINMPVLWYGAKRLVLTAWQRRSRQKSPGSD
jgi:hypothetical protein